jgi:hypothetical protein
MWNAPQRTDQPSSIVKRIPVALALAVAMTFSLRGQLSTPAAEALTFEMMNKYVPTTDSGRSAGVAHVLTRHSG